jgi:hypothetical protein
MSDLSQVKPGDYVMSDYGFGTRVYRKIKVAKVTKLHVVTDDGTKYRMNGYSISGDTWNRRSVVPFDQSLYDEGQADQRHKNLAYRLSNMNWSNLPRELVADIAAMLPAEIEATK